MNKNGKRLLVFIMFAVVLFLGIYMGIFIQKKNYSEIIKNVNTNVLLKDLVKDDICYVIGHKSPDSDTVCSALALVEYLKEQGINCEARVSGKLNNETKFVLNYFGIEVPQILDDATDKKIILVDHNEYLQSIKGMENAEIVGIFDHHGIGNVTTKQPIVSETLNIGSTATIIFCKYKLYDLKIDKKAAALIASAILSDTFNLTSKTTTKLDQYALKETAKIAGIDNVDEYYSMMYDAYQSYDGMTDEEIFLSDYKEYDMSGTKVGIACINARNKDDAKKIMENMCEEMKEVYDKKGMKHLFVVVNNGKDNQSTISGYGDGVDEVIEKVFGSKDVVLNPIASRKKDIVPKLEEVYEELN